MAGHRGILRRDVASDSVNTDSRAGGRATFGRFAEDSTRPMTLLLAAVGAVVTALLELTVGPYLRIGDAQPHLVLVLGVVVTVAVGLEAGLTWAFVGGLALDVLADRPLGSSAFALLLCVGVASLLARTFVRLRPIVPIIAVAILSVAYSMILFAALGALGTPVPVADPLSLVLPGAIYDTILAAVIGPLAIAIHDRRAAAQERVDW
jgi:rod shape-determining protein MreD